MDRILSVVLFGTVLLLVFALIRSRSRSASSNGVVDEAGQRQWPSSLPDPQRYIEQYGQPNEMMEGTVNLDHGQMRVRFLRYSTEGVQITVTRIVGTGERYPWVVDGFSELSGPDFAVATGISSEQFEYRMKQRAARVLAESQGE